MKDSNFNFLMLQYVTQKTSISETTKIEAMLTSIHERNAHFISEETEELLFQKIKDERMSPEEITRVISSLSKLRVRGLKWAGIGPWEIYFSKETLEP